MTIETRVHRPNGHDTHRSIGPVEAQCPYCGQPVSRKEFDEIRARIETEDKARLCKLETSLKDQFVREQQQAAVKAKAEIAKAKKDAATAAATQVQVIRAGQEAAIAQRVQAAREASERKLAETVSAEKVKAFEEKTKLTTQLADMQRRLEQKSAFAIGEPAEVDLFDSLQAAFPDDRISRVVKGQKGPDVIVEIVHQGDVVGKISLDSKAHARWSNRFTAKLRADQLAEGADFAILSTSVFPAGAQQLHIQDNVIVATPARVPVLVHLLRRQIVDSHRLKLTNAARDEKAEKLLAYVVSPGCSDLLDKIAKLTADMASLDATETAAHQKTWTRRGDLIRGVQAVHNEFSTAVSAIIGGAL
jgi:hypothetical protein